MEEKRGSYDGLPLTPEEEIVYKRIDQWAENPPPLPVETLQTSMATGWRPDLQTTARVLESKDEQIATLKDRNAKLERWAKAERAWRNRDLTTKIYSNDLWYELQDAEKAANG